MGQRAWAVLVDHQGEQFAAGSGKPLASTLPDEARVGRADPGEGGEEHLEAFGTCRVGAPLEIVAPVVGHPYQAGNGLGPLGVAAHPEQVLGGPGRHRRRRVDGGDRRARGQPKTGKLLGLGSQHPGVLADGAGLVGDPRAAPCGKVVGRNVRRAGNPGQAAGHGSVGALACDGEGAQHAGPGLEARRRSASVWTPAGGAPARPSPPGGPRSCAAGRPSGRS